MLLKKLQHHDSINFTPYITKGLDYGEKLSLVKGTTWSRQSLFFFRFSERSASARERRSREPRETRAAAGEEKSVPLRLAPSVKRVVICVSRACCSTD